MSRYLQHINTFIRRQLQKLGYSTVYNKCTTNRTETDREYKQKTSKAPLLQLCNIWTT